MNQLMTSFKWLALWEIQNSNVKFVKKKLLESSISKCIWKMFIKDFKKGDEWGKNFTLNIGSKEYIAAAHETKFNCD